MTKTVPALASPATYPVDATATNGIYSATASASCTVPAPMTVTMSPLAGGAFSAGQTVAITATVTSGANPVSGAAVTFTMTKAGGAQATKKATTGATGRAVWNYKVGRRDPPSPPAYSVSATAKYGGQTVSSTAPATFTVQ
jgi:hypothetical protein